MKRKMAFKDLRMEVQINIAETFKICKTCGALNTKNEPECWDCESLLFHHNPELIAKSIIDKDL